MRGRLLIAAWSVCLGCTAAPTPAPAGRAAAAPVRPHRGAREPDTVVLEAPRGDPLLGEPPVVLRVCDAITGAPIADARVTLGPEAAATDADGFVVLQPAPGAGAIRAAGYVGATVAAAHAGVVALVPAQPLRVRLTTPAGDPLPGLRVQCTHPEPVGPARTSAPGMTDAEGWVRLPDADPRPGARLAVLGAHLVDDTVDVRALGVAPEGLVWRVAPFADGDTWSRVYAGPGGRRVELRVRDAATGAPLEGVALTLRPAADPHAGYWCRTDADGAAALTVPPAPCVAEPASPFHPWELTPARARVGVDVGAVAFVAEARPTLALPAGALPTDARLWLLAGGAAAPMRAGARTPVPPGVPLAMRLRRGARDEIRPLSPLRPGEHRVLALEWPAPLPAPDFRLPERAWPPAPRPTGTLVISVRDTHGRFCSGSVALDGGPPRRGARLTFHPVPAGPHRVAVWAQGREVLVQPVRVTADAVVKLAARLRALPAR